MLYYNDATQEITIKSNRSRKMVLPMLGKAPVAFRTIVNTYTRVTRNGNELFEGTPILGLLVQPKPEFLHESNYLRNISSLIETTPLGTKQLHIYRIPIEWEPDYQKFWKGEYSQFSDKYKEHLKDVFNHYSLLNRYLTVINPQPNHKEWLREYLHTDFLPREIYSVPDKLEETIELNDFQQ